MNKVTFNAGTVTNYGIGNGVNFGVFTLHDNKPTQVSDIRDCREEATFRMIQCVRNNEDYKIRRTRTIVSRNDRAKTEAEHDQVIENCKRIVHIVEEFAGWPKTTVKKLIHTKNKQCFLYHFAGSSKWMRTPHLYSLYLLLIRLGTIARYKNSKIKTYEDLINVSDKEGTVQCRKFKVVSRKAAVLLKMYDVIIATKLTDMYSNGFVGGSEGIAALCCGNTVKSDLAHRLSYYTGAIYNDEIKVDDRLTAIVKGAEAASLYILRKY